MKLLLLVLFSLSFLCTATLVAAPGNIDPSFVPAAATFGLARSISTQPDGKIIIGGDFYDVEGVGTHDRLARLNTNGSLDSSFTPPADLSSGVYSTALQPDGRLIVGGRFSDVDGTGTRNYLVRLESNGLLDTSFNPPDLNSGIFSIALQPDGRIIVGGRFFETDPPYARNYVIRLESNGSLDTSYNPPVDLSSTVVAICLQPDGKLVIGGGFREVTDNPNLNYLVRLDFDGTLDTLFIPPADLNATVNSLSLQADGKIIVGGDFTGVGTADLGYLIRLNSNGSLDSAFAPPAGIDDRVSSTTIQTDGKIIVGGRFGGGESPSFLTRLNSDGSRDDSFVPPPRLR